MSKNHMRALWFLAIQVIAMALSTINHADSFLLIGGAAWLLCIDALWPKHKE